jgi:hypothetical protein
MDLNEPNRNHGAMASLIQFKASILLEPTNIGAQFALQTVAFDDIFSQQ